ncbi:peptidoglycan-binding protein LysM [Dyadobacter beijingensis]|uniref:Peptidoglycan-binding protein LysM n=1 Tax=Dyadobacter beijingensis TaxID=365489 RepID=A0ABQ2ICV0_9BACT|nr:peptidoglycan-binding protein LysM [Dyadobacter beijingensis]GGN07311.1 peptidoglycan-binding protein LysM [Dyadobacter beijingensis]
MGLLSFIKGVGQKVFNKQDAAIPEREAEPLRASALLAHVKSLGLAYNNLAVKLSGDTVILEGEVAKQEDAEKIALAVGNVEGVGLVDSRLHVATPAPAATYHTVEAGDTLSRIALKVYGDMHKYPVIFEANKPMLSDPDLIYPGQVLRIPAL